MTEQHSGRQCRVEVTAWVAWHAGELVALGIPSVLALTVSVWFWAVAAIGGAGWVSHEIHQQRRRRVLRASQTRQQVTGAADTSSPSGPATADSDPTREGA